VRARAGERRNGNGARGEMVRDLARIHDVGCQRSRSGKRKQSVTCDQALPRYVSRGCSGRGRPRTEMEQSPEWMYALHESPIAATVAAESKPESRRTFSYCDMRRRRRCDAGSNVSSENGGRWGNSLVRYELADARLDSHVQRCTLAHRRRRCGRRNSSSPLSSRSSSLVFVAVTSRLLLWLSLSRRIAVAAAVVITVPR
jgi:hypothetical protein